MLKSEVLIYLYALARGGTHAMAQWLMHQHPAFTKTHEIHHYRSDVWYIEENGVYSLLFNYMQNYDFIPWAVLEEMKIEKCAVAIISYENWDTENLLKKEFNFSGDHTHKVMSLRDFPNFAASVYKGRGLGAPHLPTTWKDRASYVLKQDPRFHYLHFTDWLRGKSFQQELEKINLMNTNLARDKTNLDKFGGGSSFDKNVQSTQLTRYKEYPNNPILINNPDAVEMSEKIFGKIGE